MIQKNIETRLGLRVSKVYVEEKKQNKERLRFIYLDVADLSLSPLEVLHASGLSDYENVHVNLEGNTLLVA